MIRYPITLAAIKGRIAALKATWFDRTIQAINNLPAKPKSSDFNALWSEIKDVYIELQHSKCAFCEKPLEGRIEQDVEHFRPKAEVEPWQPPQDLVTAGLNLRQPGDGSKELGYRFLAYHPLNYAAACKTCNSIFKGNLFPIAGPRKTKAKRPPANSTEQPYLIYPISKLDDDPEDLINFVGCVPQPVKPAGHDRLRAQVTISIFKLDDPVERRVFYVGRAKSIQLLFLNLVTIDDSADQPLVQLARSNVTRMLRASEPYANCLRCFNRLYGQSRADATQVFHDLTVFLDTVSP